MRRSIWERIREILKKHVLHGKWVRAVISLACVVIFITTYVLIMPAVTLSRAADCGQEEHTHTEDCYETESELTCGQEEHTHSGDCYDEEGNLICGMEEHVHDDGCYTCREVLVCGQEEHVHTEDCWAETEPIQEDIPKEEQEEPADEEGQPQTGDTVTEQAAVAAPEQLSQIRFKEYLTDWTTIYYVPEDGDNWQPLAEDKWHSLYEDNWGIRRNETEDRGLDPEEEVLLHIGYRIPAGQINATNPQTEFILPLSINMTEEEVRNNNNNNYTLFSGTDREENELFVDGEYEIVEEWNSDGEVTLRKLVITLNEDACLRCGGEKLADGTKTLAPQELEGFFELRVKAEDLLTLKKQSESAYVLKWNDEEDLDSTVRFDPEKLAAYYDAKNGESAETEETEVEEPVSRELRAEGEDYTITVSYTEEAGLPADVSLKVKEITKEKEYESYKAQMEEELIDLESTKVTGARFFDITLEDSEGNELHPERGVRVLIETKDTLKEDEKVQICHFDEEKDKPVEVESREVTSETYEEENLGVEFEAESFSVYGVVYTVDFHYEVNGKMYEFSLPGGGFVSFPNLVELLGIIDDTNADKNDTDIDAAEVQNANVLPDVTVSDAVKKFVADVDSVKFSSPELVDVSKVENGTTVGQIKKSRGLECEYSAELTEDQIAEINAQTVEAGDWALISVQPFISEEELTVTMKDGEVFTIRVTDAQIKKTVIDAKGDTWEIIVTYDDSAEIPDGAELEVEEILPEDERYQDHYEKAAKIAGNEALGNGIEWPVITGERLFNIEIRDQKSKIEPAAPVQVDIRLLGKTAETMSVVHFAEGGPEAMTLRKVETSANGSLFTADRLMEHEEKGSAVVANDQTDKSVEPKVSSVSFVTSSFSVYSVVKVDNGTDLVNGGPWTLVTGIANDPGATTGYSESWGRDYFTIIVNANAMSDVSVKYQDNDIAYEVEGVHAWTDGAKSYVGGEVPQVWRFERRPNGNYYIYVERNGQKYYINQHYYNGSLHDTTNLSPQYPTEFTIDRNSDGTISIHNGNWYLCNSGNGEFVGRDFRFSNSNNIQYQNSAKFRLCKQSDEFDSSAARKVSVQDLTSNDSFLIYRKFVSADGTEELYALASDGTFIRVYDGGDTVYWRETDKNIYWNYLQTGTYYGIFSRNPETNELVYLNPMSSTGTTITSEPSNLTLIGKDNGEYSTAIENWDQTAYDYAGLHVTVNNGTASLSTGTRVAGTSDEFLFAIASQMPGATAQTVDTVDSDSLGIKITMFDYGDPLNAYSAGHKLSGMTNAVGSGSDAYTPHAAHALVTNI